jgi:flagellar M-ring protein FliF
MIAPLQQQITSFWKHQTSSQKITLIVLVVAAAIIIPLLISWATTPQYAVAFTGLSESDASQIVAKLDEAGTPYKLNGTSTIMVPENQVYSTRLTIAKDGLPANSTVGFEIFDSNSLGMTEFTQKVNYQRALEGELEKTISSVSAVDGVRVHIVTPEKTLLSSTQDPTTASVMLKIKAGKSLDQAQVQSITHLVASSVEGLKAEDVVIVDSNGRMLAAGSSADDAASVAQSDSHRSAEINASTDLQNRVQTMLASVLGPDKAIVQANVTLDWTQKEITSQSYDPTPAAIRSSQKTNETYTTSGGTTGGVPGASSNLPTPVPTTTGSSSSTTYSRTDETTNYEISQSVSKEVVTPGQIKKISLAVLVDNITDQAQLDTLKAAVTAAAGIDANRGDSISVQSVAFDRTYYTQQEADLTKTTSTDMYWKIGEIAGAVILLALLLFYIQRLLKNVRLASADAWVPVMKPITDTASLGAASGSASAPLIGSGSMIAAPAAIPQASMPRKEQQPVIPPTQSHPEDDQMAKVLTRMTEENPASVAEIIQLWLSEDEKNHG